MARLSRATRHFKLDVAELSDVGNVRPHNEDYVAHFHPQDVNLLLAAGRLYIVADGVGGAAAGELASQYATRQVLHSYYASSADSIEARLAEAFQQANRDLYQHALSQGDGRTMGTTMVAAVIHGDQLVVANVGDSRAYLLRAGRIQQLTRDHSWVAMLMAEGEITPEQARAHPQRNVIMRSLGKSEEVVLDTFRHTLMPGDTLLLCTDGLYNEVTDAEMARIASKLPPIAACQQLVALAKQRGGKDNITLAIIRVGQAVSNPLQLVAPQDAAATLRLRHPGKQKEPRRAVWPILAATLLALAVLCGAAWLLWTYYGPWNQPEPTIAPTAGPQATIPVGQPETPGVTPTTAPSPTTQPQLPTPLATLTSPVARPDTATFVPTLIPIQTVPGTPGTPLLQATLPLSSTVVTPITTLTQTSLAPPGTVTRWPTPPGASPTLPTVTSTVTPTRTG